MIQQMHGRHPVTSSVKGVTGHSLGAAGAVEESITALSLKHQLAPATAGLTHQDPAIELDIGAGKSRKVVMDAVLSNSFGFGGQNAALVLTRA